MNRLQKYLSRKAAIVKEMDGVLSLAESEGRELNEAEKLNFSKLESDLGAAREGDKAPTGIYADIEREEKLQAHQRFVAPAITNPGSAPGADQLNAGGFKKVRIEGRSFKPKHFATAEDAYLSGRFIRAAIERREDDLLWCREHGVQSLAGSTAQSSTNNAWGGFLIPDQLANAVINLKEQYGVFGRNAKRWPMSGDTLTIPRRSGGVTTYYANENTDATASRVTFDAVQLTARKLVSLVVYPQELADDAAISLADHLVNELGYAFAKAEDDAGFIGDGTSTYGGIQGITTAIGSASVATAATGNVSFETLDLDDFEVAVAKLPEYARARAKWYISSAGFAASMMRLAYAAGGNTTENIAGGMQRTFLGFPVEISQSLNSTLGSDTSKIKALLGDLSLSSAYGDRMGFSVAADRSVYFLADQVAVKATQRFDIVNHDVGTSSVAGPVVAVKTAAS